MYYNWLYTVNQAEMHQIHHPNYHDVFVLFQKINEQHINWNVFILISIIEVYPSPTISTCVVEPDDALLSTHWLWDHTEVSLLLDNEGIYEIDTIR